MKKIGIWIDRKQAKVYSLSETEERIETISSNLHSFKHKGYSRAAMKWGGPQDVLPAKTMEEREKNELNKYFDEVIHTIGKADAIAVFGPGEIPRMFTHHLERKDKILWTRLKTVEKSDKLSDRQFTAHVRNFYRWGSA